MDWYNSDNVLKRRLVSYYGKLWGLLYYKPLRNIGIILGAIFSRMPISFSSSFKESLKLTTNMLPLHLGIKVVVNHRKDHGRAQFCGKEKLTCEWIKDYYKKGDVIYDIGANIGAVSLISAFYLEKDCKIYAFEPLPSTYGTLFENIMLNNCDKIITPINTALSNKMERDQFHLTSTGSGSSGHSVSGSAVHIKNNEKILNILTQTLDNFVDFYHIEQPNHIKIDVDGHDYEVLMGGEKNILNNKSLKTILIEKNNKEEKIRTLLKKYGFVEIELKDHRGIYENMGFVRGA